MSSVVGGDEGGLFGGSDFGGLGGCSGFAGQQALVGAVAKLPELEAHAEGDDEKDGTRGSFDSAGSRLLRLRAAGVGAPLEHCGGKGGGDAGLVVRIVGFGSDRCCRRRVAGAISMARAGQVMLSIPGKGMRPRVTVKPACVRAELSDAGKAEAAGDPGGLSGFPCQEARGLAGASEEAKRCIPVPLSLACRLRQTAALAWLASSARLVEVDGGVGFAGGDDLDAAGGQQGAEADIEGEVDGFFELAAVEVGAGIVAAVGGIEDDDETGGGRWRLGAGVGDDGGGCWAAQQSENARPASRDSCDG